MPPAVCDWFDKAKASVPNNEAASVDLRKINALYPFIHAMPEFLETALHGDRKSNVESRSEQERSYQRCFPSFASRLETCNHPRVGYEREFAVLFSLLAHFVCVRFYVEHEFSHHRVCAIAFVENVNESLYYSLSCTVVSQKAARQMGCILFHVLLSQSSQHSREPTRTSSYSPKLGRVSKTPP